MEGGSWSCRGVEDFMEAKRHRDEGTVRPFLRTSAERDDTFVVLVQGGNYDAQDRKGWDASIQAFKLFHDRVESESERDPQRYSPHAHLYLHPVESYLIESDTNNGDDPPPAVLPTGVNLRKRIYHSGLSRDSYTLDSTLHHPDVVP